jgi:amino acid permease
MKNNLKYFLYSSATLIGYIIGAGIFGIPYVMKNFGFYPALILLVFITTATIINSFALLEILLRTRGNHYFPGLMKVYFGKKGKIFQSFSSIISGFGAIFSYIVIGSVFLKNLLIHFLGDFELLGFDFLYALIFGLLGAFFIYKGFEDLGFIEIILSLILILVIGLIFIKSLDQIEASNFLNFDLKYSLVCVGVMITAIDGISGIFVLKEKLKKRENLLRSAILTSYSISLIVFILFSFSIVGILGDGVTGEGILGIGFKLGAFMEKLASFLGFIAVFSSFIVVGSVLKNTFKVDFKFNHFWSFILVSLLPIFGFFLLKGKFIAIISILGVTFGTINSLVILLMLQKSRKIGLKNPKFVLKTPVWVHYIIIGLYLIGLIYEIKNFVL